MYIYGKPFQPSPIFVGKARILIQSGVPERRFTWVGSEPYSQTLTWLERFAEENHSLRTFVINGRKKFCNIDARSQC